VLVCPSDSFFIGWNKVTIVSAGEQLLELGISHYKPSGGFQGLAASITDSVAYTVHLKSDGRVRVARTGCRWRCERGSLQEAQCSRYKVGHSGHFSKPAPFWCARELHHQERADNDLIGQLITVQTWPLPSGRSIWLM